MGTERFDRRIIYSIKPDFVRILSYGNREQLEIPFKNIFVKQDCNLDSIDFYNLLSTKLRNVVQLSFLGNSVLSKLWVE